MEQLGDTPYDPETEALIYETLKKADTDLNIKQISDRTELHRNTVRTYIKVLLHTNKIVQTRTIGKSVLYTDKE